MRLLAAEAQSSVFCPRAPRTGCHSGPPRWDSPDPTGSLHLLQLPSSHSHPIFGVQGRRLAHQGPQSPGDCPSAALEVDCLPDTRPLARHRCLAQGRQNKHSHLRPFFGRDRRPCGVGWGTINLLSCAAKVTEHKAPAPSGPTRWTVETCSRVRAGGQGQGLGPAA